MKKLIWFINVTPDGSCDHTAVVADDELHQFANSILKEVDTVLFGRTTFQLFESYWPAVAVNNTGPQSEMEFAHLIDAIPKVVFSRTLQTAGWKNARVSKVPLKEEIEALKQQDGKNLLLMGSPGLAAACMKLGVIDELRFCVQPIIAGKGRRLFEDIDRVKLTLIATKKFESGADLLCYIPEK
jgi:dihydrofolate reductase